jgi:hypothetical protein
MKKLMALAITAALALPMAAQAEEYVCMADSYSINTYNPHTGIILKYGESYPMPEGKYFFSFDTEEGWTLGSDGFLYSEMKHKQGYTIHLKFDSKNKALSNSVLLGKNEHSASVMNMLSFCVSSKDI